MAPNMSSCFTSDSVLRGRACGVVGILFIFILRYDATDVVRTYAPLAVFFIILACAMLASAVVMARLTDK